MYTTKAASPEQTSEPTTNQVLALRSAEKVAVRALVQAPISVQKDSTGTMKDDLRSFERQIMRRQRDIEQATEQIVRLHENIVRWKEEEKEAAARIVYMDAYLKQLQNVEVATELLGAQLEG